MPPRTKYRAGDPNVTTRRAATASVPPDLPPPETIAPTPRGSPSKRATPAQPPSKTRSRNAGAAGRGAAPDTTTSVAASRPAVKALKGELEEQAVLASNAYGGKAQARAPVELVANAANNSAGALLGSAVAGAIQQTTTSTGVQLPGATTTSRPASSNGSGNWARNGSQRTSRSSARSGESVAAANSLVGFAGFSRGATLSNGDRAVSAPSSSSSGSSSGSPSFLLPSRRAATAPASRAPISGSRPGPRTGQWLPWFTPVAWLQALLFWGFGLVLATGRIVKLIASRAWSILAAGLPLVLALIAIVFLTRVCYVHYSAPASGVTLGDRFAAPFSVLPAPSIAAPVVDCVSNGKFKELTTRVTAVEDRVAMAPTQPVPQIQREVNFFAPGTGVMINPYLTSPTRPLTVPQHPGRRPRRSAWQRLMGTGKGSSSHSIGADLYRSAPSIILHPWDDAGDCWCSPCSNGKAQVGITLPAPMVPQELVVEHMPQSGLLPAAAAATPQDMELWVQIADESKRARIEASALDNVAILSEDGSLDSGPFHEDLDTRNALDDTWVRIGYFRYEKDGPEVQAFEIPVDLAHFGVTVSNLALRTVGSWGTSKSVCIYRLKMHGISADQLAERMV